MRAGSWDGTRGERHARPGSSERLAGKAPAGYHGASASCKKSPQRARGGHEKAGANPGSSFGLPGEIAPDGLGWIAIEG